MAVMWALLWGSFTSMRPSSNSSLSSGRKKPRSTSCSYSHRLQRRMRTERACIIRVRVGRYRRLRQRRWADTPGGTVWSFRPRVQLAASPSRHCGSRLIEPVVLSSAAPGGAMKICFFHLMPYRFLPVDFEQRYRSVWVDVPHHLHDPEKTRGLYHEFLDELEFAEAQGFDGLCVNEHHNNAYGLMPSPNLMAAALTRRTSQAAIVVLGNSLAAYNPPLRVAEEFAMLDLLSGGRPVAGFPVGTSMDMNFAYGVNPATLRDRDYQAP